MPRPFRLPATRRAVERDLDDELALHIAMRAEQLERAGHSAEEARAEARRLFGDTDHVRATCLEIDEAARLRTARWNAIDEWRQDTAFAMRTMRRDVSFSILAVLVLALGIGATTAIFSVYDRVVRHPIAVAHADRIMWVTSVGADGESGVSPAALTAWRERGGDRAFERLTSVRSTAATLLAAGDPMRLEGVLAGEGFFDVFATRAAAGRLLQPTDFSAGSAPTVLISFALWQDRFGGDPRVVGRSIDLDGELREVVGVLPADLDVLGSSAQFVIPDRLPTRLRDNWTPILSVVGRLHAGIDDAAAARELDGIVQRRWLESHREPLALHTRVVPLIEQLTAPFRDRVALLLAGVACLLLIGCVNVTNLLLSRGAVRAREMAVRASLGASRLRLVRQLLSEHAILALCGGAFGLLLASWMVRGLTLVLPPDLPRLASVHVDPRAIGVASALGLITLLLTGLAPALRVSRVDLRESLQGGGRGATAGRASDRLRRAFVVAQVAATTVLLVMAGLLIRSSSALGRVAPGFALDDVVTARYSLPAREYESPAKVLLAHEAVRTGVQAALGPRVALASAIPLGDGGGGSGFVSIGGERRSEREVNAGLRFVSPGYLQTMGIALLRGRDIAEEDRRGAPPVVVVSEGLVRTLGLPDDAVGRFVGGTSSPFKDSTGTPIPMRIVGVVREPRDRGLREQTTAQVFFPLAQTPDEVFDWSARSVHVVTRGLGRERSVAAIAGAVHRVDPKLPLEDVRTMGERLRAAVALERANITLLTSLGVAALLLAVSGLYGVIAFSVAQRRPEIGVRLALGAQPRDIVTMIVRWGGRMVVIGLALGAPVAIAAARAGQALLFGVAPFDLPTLAAVASLLIVVAMASTIVPARRASRIRPAAVLQGEG